MVRVLVSDLFVQGFQEFRSWFLEGEVVSIRHGVQCQSFVELSKMFFVDLVLC